MDEVEVVGRSLPMYILGPVLALFVIVLAVTIRRTPSRAGQFVLFAIGARFILAALHDITYDASPLKLSWNALGSVAVCLAGLFVVRRRSPFDVALVPFYALLTLMVASGLSNGEPASLSTVLTKYGYLMVLTIATTDALEDLGPDRLCRQLLWLYTMPLTLQAFSVATGLSKPGEDGGAASYIGGFYHEAGFSMMIASGILVVCLTPRFRLRVLLPLILLLLASVVLANYRTAILGVLPLIGATVLVTGPRRFLPEQRGLVVGAFLILTASVAGAGVILERDRFADIGVAATQGTALIKRPETFSVEERRILSGRPGIWSRYIYGWVDATPMRKLIGFGPETWTEAFRLYAHNTLISALYEIGVLGLILTVSLWLWMFALALLSRGPQRGLIVSGHIGFFILNMATMPMWMIEGMIFYGILCGYTVFYFKQSRVAALGIRRRILPSAPRNRLVLAEEV